MRYQSSGSALFAAMSLSVLGIAGSALAKPEPAGATVQDAGTLVNEARVLAKDGKLQEALTKLDAAVKAVLITQPPILSGLASSFSSSNLTKLSQTMLR